MDNDIVTRLEFEPSYSEHSDAKQLRRDAAEEIRALRRQTQQLEALIQRRASKSMARRVA